MKHRYSFIQLLTVLLLVSGLSPVFGQTVRIFTEQTLVENNTKLEIAFKVQNTSSAPIALGRSDILFSVNSGALNSQLFQKTTDGIWDDGLNPRFFEDTRFPFIQSTDQFFCSIRRTVNDTTANVATINFNQIGLISTIVIPITDCQGFSGLQFDAVNSVVRNFSGTALTVTYANQAIQLAGPTPVVTVSQEPGTAAAEPTRYCFNDIVTITATGDASVTKYKFYKLSGGSEDSLTGWQTSGVFNLNLNRITDRDSVVVYVKTATCYYRVAQGAFFQIENFYNVAPTPSDPSARYTRLCVNSPNSTYSVNPVAGALRYQWSIDRRDAGSFVGDSTGTNVQINWNNTYVGPVTIKVRAINTCGLNQGSLLDFVVRIDAGRPAAPAVPVPSMPYTPPVCINALAITSFTVPAGNLSYDYFWNVSPSNAVERVTVLETSDTMMNQRTVNITWKRNYTGNNVRISVAAANSCGLSDSTILNIDVLPLPLKPLRIISSVATSLLCQGDTTAVTFTMVPNPASAPAAPTDAYRWYFRVSTNPLNQFYPGLPNTVLLPNPNLSFVTSTPTITVKASPEFFGYYQIVGAIAGANCEGPEFQPENFGLEGGFRDLQSSAIGDTVYADFFMTPRPRRDRAEAPTGARAICKTGGADTAIFNYTPSRYAIRYSWRVDSVPGGPSPILLGNFLSTDSLVGHLVLSPTAPVGDYYVKVLASNACGAGDTSTTLRIRVSNTPSIKIDSMFVYYANNNLTIDKKDSLNRTNIVRFCKTSGDITSLYALVKYDNGVFDTVARGSNTALYYRWDVLNSAGIPIPGSVVRGVNSSDIGAGVGKLAGVNGLPTVANPFPKAFANVVNRLKAPNKSFSSDSSVVQISIPANYYGAFSIVASPVNGCNFGSVPTQNDSSFTYRGGFYERPSAYPGRSTDMAASKIPVGTNYRLGGGSVVYSTLPTASVVNGPLNKADFKWTAVTPATTILNATDSINPIVRSTIAGNAVVNFRVWDSLGCGNSLASQNVTIASYNAYNLSLKVLLQGPFDSTANRMHDSLYNRIDATNGNIGVFQSRYERRNLTTGVPLTEPKLLPGVAFPSSPGNQVVDFVKVELYRDGATNPNQSSNLIAEGYAFVKQDGSLVDAYTANLPYVNLNKTNATFVIGATERFYVRVVHRNHLQIYTNETNQVHPVLNAVPGTSLDSGFVDMTVPANVYQEVQGVNGSNVKIINGKALMIAGNIPTGLSATNLRYSSIEINAHDIKMVGEQVVTAAPAGLAAFFRTQDINISGAVNKVDYLITLRNASRLLFSTNP